MKALFVVISNEYMFQWTSFESYGSIFLWHVMVGVANSLTISALSQDTMFQDLTSHIYVFVH